MKKNRKKTFLLLAAVCLTTFSFAQKHAIAPRDSSRALFDGKRISVNYGKPSMEGRKIFGEFVPYYKVWRTGNGAATLLTTDADLEIDGAVLPRGTYSLYTLPAKDAWKLIINKQTGQWGTIYNPQLDLARINLNAKILKTPVEALTFRIEKKSGGGGILRIAWETTELSAPFQISKDGILPSPRDSVSIDLGGKYIRINYGRPSMRGRKIMGSVVPYGKVWRTGANAATGLTLSGDIRLGGTLLSKGAYTLYTIPSPKEWKLLVNKQTGQWGTVHNAKLDLYSLPMKIKKLSRAVEKFSIVLDQTGPKKGVLRISWEKTEASIDFSLRPE
jgi:hypothetical protein